MSKASEGNKNAARKTVKRLETVIVTDATLNKMMPR